MTDSVKEQVGDLVTKAKRRVGVEQPSAADDEGNIGIVRGALRTFGEGDTDGFLDTLREDVLWEGPSGGHFPGGGEQLGRDAVRSEFVENAGRTFTDFGFKPESFIEADDVNAVVVIGRFEGDGVEGDRLDEPAVQIWELQGTAVSRVRIFTDSAGFPSVITERRQKEIEEEEREKKEKEESKDEDKDKDADSASGEAKASSEEDESSSDDEGDDEGDSERKDRDEQSGSDSR
jgi:ketosteroid isomerase-like protein